MASQELREKIRDELQCSLCFNMITEPKVLQCPHTFCRQCLEKHNAFLRTNRSSTDCENPLREDEFECPTCRQITQLPRGRIDSLPTILQLAKVARLLGAEGEQETDRAPQLVCQEHSTPQQPTLLDNFCEACGKLVCYRCMHSPQHSSHKQSIHFANDVLPKRVDALQTLAKGIATEVAATEQLREAMQERHVRNRDETTRAIKASHEKMLTLLQKRVNSLLAAVHESTEGKLAALEESLQTLTEAKNFTGQTSKDIERTLKDTPLNVLVREQALNEELTAHQQAIQKVGKLLSGSGAKLDLVLRFEEDSGYINHTLSTFGHLTECQFDLSTVHDHPQRLRIRGELQVGDGGETYITYASARPPPQQRGMMPPFGVPYPTPGPGYVIAINPTTMTPMPIQVAYPGSFESSSSVVGGNKVNEKPLQVAAPVSQRNQLPTPNTNSGQLQNTEDAGATSEPEDSDFPYSYAQNESKVLVIPSRSGSMHNFAALTGVHSPSPGASEEGCCDIATESNESRNLTGLSMAAGQSCTTTPQPPPFANYQAPSQGSPSNTSQEGKREANDFPPLPPRVTQPSVEDSSMDIYVEVEPAIEEPEELYEDMVPRAEPDTPSITPGVSVSLEEHDFAPSLPRRSGSFPRTRMKRSPSPTPQPSKAASQSSTPQYRRRGFSACAPLLPVRQPPPPKTASPGGSQRSPDYGEEGIYDEVDGPVVLPPATNGDIPPLPPKNPLRPMRASIIEPIQMIESHQFGPKPSINVRPSDVCCTGVYNNIIITDQSNHCLRVVDSSGRFARQIGKRGGEDGCFDVPVALAVTSDSYFYYVVDQQNARIQKFAADGTLQFKFGKKKGQQILRKPQGIAIRPATGDVYVADSEKRRVYVYRSDGTYICPIGKNERTIAFNCPVSVAITKSDHLLVTDRFFQGSRKNCVWCIRQPEEELIRKFGEGVLQNPSGIAATDSGTILVSELDNGTVCVFSHEGDLIHRFGRMGVEPGMFNQPCGISINGGQAIIADKGNNRVQIFNLKDILREE